MNTNNLINKSRARRWIKTGLFIMVAMALMQACASSRIPEGARIIEDTPTKNIPTKTPYVTPTVPGVSALTATAAVIQTHKGAVRFMGYNVQEGATEKFVEVMSILQAYNADVLAIQEANGWLADDFAIANQVAADLGMEYVYCQADGASVDKNGNTFDLVLFSKLKIKNSETYANVSNCLIRAEVVSAGGQAVQVFAVQVRPNFDEVGCQNVANMAEVIAPYAQDTAILLGDMTMPPPGVLMGYPENQIVCPPLLEAAGWYFFNDVSRVDHVWVTPAMKAIESFKLPSPTTGILVAKNVARNTSDHLPLAVDFFLP